MLETIVETRYRKYQNSANMAKKRELEGQSKTLFRLKQNQANMAKKRLLESPSDTLCRQQDQESKTPITCENLIMAPAFNIEHSKCHIIKSVTREK